MKRSRGLVLAGGAAALALAAAACGYTPPVAAGGSGGYYAAGSPVAPVTAPGPAVPAVEISTAALGPGTALVDGSGRAVYLFENDSTSASTCAGACASVWPPVPALTGTPSAGGTESASVGSTPRPDGGAQLTYDGHPLYYYIGDHNPGDSRGQGLDQFGAHWYLVQRSGAELGNDR
jgi:predicted lipoprotein with Yx(FWY)xxD motif